MHGACVRVCGMRHTHTQYRRIGRKGRRRVWGWGWWVGEGGGGWGKGRQAGVCGVGGVGCRGWGGGVGWVAHGNVPQMVPVCPKTVPCLQAKCHVPVPGMSQMQRQCRASIPSRSKACGKMPSLLLLAGAMLQKARDRRFVVGVCGKGTTSCLFLPCHHLSIPAQPQSPPPVQSLSKCPTPCPFPILHLIKSQTGRMSAFSCVGVCGREKREERRRKKKKALGRNAHCHTVCCTTQE